jgi:uncharacterized damage-inducible protein DinB
MVEDQTTGRADSLPRTVTELLERLTREREALQRAGTDLSDEAFVATSVGWSVKDHLAHVSAWERRLVGEVRGDHAVARFGLDEDAFSTTNGDVLNAMLHARHRDDPPAMVRAEFRAAGEALRATLAELTDADLMQPVRPDDPHVKTLDELIAWDTFWHYPEHVAAIAGHA